MIKERRKMTIDLAFKLESIFKIDSNLWLLIQSKNELLMFDSDRKTEYTKYQLKDLLKKAS